MFANFDSLFDEGRWEELLQQARRQAVQTTTRKPMTEEARTKKAIEKAIALVEEGELSHAARALQAAALAPGSQATLDELRDARLRPPEPVEPISSVT